MKKSLSLITLALLAYGASAQLAKRYVLFEHFTQASCGPCADQNPGFQDNILKNNEDNVHHIAFHTSWPGVDPMNAHNAPQVKSRVDYYGVTGVPNMIMDGVNKGGPGAIKQSMVDAALSLGSPVKIEVSQAMGMDSVYNITVKVTSVGTPPEGTFKLLTALVEKDVVYATPPGNNGEKDFPNVFRKMVTANNGNDITLPAKGEFIELTYSAPHNSVWNAGQIYTIAYLQSTSKEVINSGSSLNDPAPVTYGFLGDPNRLLAAGTPNNSTPFTFSISNTGSAEENYRITLSKNAPVDWDATLTFNGTIISTEGIITLPGGASSEALLSVIPGTSAAVGDFNISFVSVDSPGSITFLKNVKVISNVTDLIISSVNPAGDFESAAAFEPVYTSGLTSAGNTSFASSDSKFLEDALRDGIMNGVRNVYLNVGWSFDVLTGGMITELSKFIDSGGNLFIAGQDIGWESNDNSAANGYYTLAKKNFFRDYLKLGYTADNANSFTLIANSGEFFSAMGTSTIRNNFYGTAASTYYPDQINIPAGSPALPIFYYNASKTKLAGARIADNVKKSKIVYMGIGPEQLADDAKKAMLIKLSHDYFYSSVGINKSNSTGEILGECYPNPASGFVTFTFGQRDKDMTLKILDLTGKEVYTQPVWSDMDKTSVNTSSFQAGIYFYQLVEDNNVIATRKLTVVK